ncbi:hypothetical protein CP061683_1451A, partial [Chlamydia psittaci 06-1683]
MEHNLLLNK